MICPNCKKRISQEDKFCPYCGLTLKKEIERPEEKLTEEKQFSFKQPIFHLILLYIFTFGLYGIYWFYKTWKQIKEHTEANFSPKWRTVGLFIPFYNIWRVYTLFNDIKSLRLKADFSENPSPGWLTFLFFLFTYLTNRLPDPWWLFGSLGVVIPLVSAQGALNDYWEKEQSGRKEKTKFSTKEIAVMIVGGLLIALAFWAIFIWTPWEYEYSIPSLTQEQISAVVLLVCPDDNVEYNEFFSIGSGVIVNPDEGNIFTNRHVVLNKDWSIIESSPTCFVGVTDDISQPPKLKYLADLVAYSPQVDEYFGFDIAVLDIYDVCPKSDCEDAPLFLPSSFPFLESGYSEYLVPGSYVAIAGYPEIGAETFTLTDGIISGRVGDFVLKTDAKIDAGNSGGAALNDMNLLIGIPTWAITGEAESIGYIIDIDSIFDWYEKKVIPSGKMIVPFE